MNNFLRKPEYKILTAGFCIMILSFINLIFIRDGAFLGSYSFKQLIWTIAAGIICFIVLRIRLQTLKNISVSLYILSIILLVFVLFFGDKISGARSWIKIGDFMSFQPSELVKISFIFIIAKFYSELGAYSKSYLVKYFLGLVFFLLPFALIMLQPDLGSALMLLIVSLTVIISFSYNQKILIIIILIIASLSVPIWSYALKDYQKERIVSFIYPEKDPSGYGYNVIQSKVAIGSGQLIGKGLGNSSQAKLKFLPEKHTDFAFSVWAEQTGFLGSIILIGLYAFIVIYSLYYLNKIKDNFLQVLLFGLSSYFFFHLFINVAMTIGFFPVVGIPLLMFSYGGSSLMCGAMALGIIALIISEYKDVNRLGL